MPAISLSPNLAPSTWNTQTKNDKKNAAQATAVGNGLKQFESKHDAIKWDLLDVDKLQSKGDIEKRIGEVEAAQKSALGDLQKQAGVVAKAASDYVGKAGKEIDKKVADLANKMKGETDQHVKTVESKFAAALKTLNEKLKAAGSAAAKKSAEPAGPTAAQKADEKLLIKLSKKAVAAAMKPKPGAIPPMFAILGTKPGKGKVLMGSKSDVTKLIGKFGKKDPTTGHKPPLVKDPKSQILFENGALIFVSARIPAKFLALVKKAMKPQLTKSPKVKWRKPGSPDVEAEGGGDEMKAEDLHVEDEAVDPREQAAAKRQFDDLMKIVTTSMPAQIKSKSADDQADIKEALQIGAKAAAKGDYVEALSQVEAAQNMLDEAPEVDDSGDDEGETSANAPAAAGGAAAKTAASANAPAAKTAAAGNGAAAKPGAASAQAASGMAALGDEWKSICKSAHDEVQVLKTEIEKLYPSGDQNVKKALEDLQGAIDTYKSGLDTALKGLANANDADKAKLSKFAQAKVTELWNHVNGNKIMANLDNNEVKAIKAQASLKAGLEKIKSAIGA